MKYSIVIILMVFALCPDFVTAKEIPISSALRCRLVPFSRACNQMSVLLYRQIAKSRKNVVFSPLSIFTEISLLMAGAKGATLHQMKARLYMKLMRRKEVLQLFHDLHELIKSDPNVEFRSVNTIFESNSIKLSESSKNEIKYAFNATFPLLAPKPEKQLSTYFADVTKGKIEQLLTSEYSSLSWFSGIYITNALYFRARWKQVFNESWTGKRPFYLDGDEVTDTSMMSQTGYFRIKAIKSLKCVVVELPYLGDRFSFYVLLPDKRGGLKYLEKHLSALDLESILYNLGEPELTDVALPKFTMSNVFDLNGVLRNLGFTRVLSSVRSNLSRFGSHSLYLLLMRHHASIDVNEEGTEMAAVTAGDMNHYAMPRFIEVNRPFMFLLRDKKTNFNLLMGKMYQPD